MPSSVATDRDAMERTTLADVCGRQAKAELHPQPAATRLRDVAAEAIRATGKQEAAAREIGIDPGRLSHKLKDGSLTLAQLELLGPEYAAILGQELQERYGDIDPKARLRREIRELRQRADIVAELAMEITG